MEFNYFKTSVVSVMAVGALAFSASVMGASPVSVLPQEGQQETLEDFTLVFAEGDEVAWAVTGTENTPYLTLNGETCALAAPSNIAAEGNQLSINFGREFTAAGEYQLVIAEGSYTINGVPGDACKFDWTVSGISIGYTVEPAVNVLSEIQNIKITFNEAKEITLAEELGTENTPLLFIINAEDQRERRGTFFPEVVGGNNLLLTMRSPITEPGEYVVVVPGSTYFLDGEAGEDIELIYTVAEPSYPEVELSVNPATDVVETIDTIELTFGGVEIVEWAVTGTENAPYLEDLDGNRMGTFAKLSGEGNMLSMGFYTEFDVKGEYKVVVPEGSYIFQGIYHGMPGKEINLHFEVLGLGGITVEPGVDVLSEIQNIKITFNEASEVTLAEELGTENTPYLALVNEEGGRERRGTFFPEIVGGNNMLLTMRSPITEPGEYVVIIPGSTYFLDGEAGEDIELIYTIVEPSYPDVDLSVNPATDVVETIDTIELTFGGVEIVEWAVTGTENAPYLEDMEGNRMGTFAVLGGQGNMLSMGFYTEFDVKGEYKVVIPEGSYIFQGIYHGMPGKEITLHFEVLGLTGYSVEPAVNVLSEIQNIKITFHDAKEVTLAEDLGTENTPLLYIINAEDERERRGTFFPEIVGGNNMLLTMRSPITEPGEYVVVIPGSTYFLDGEAGEDIELIYTVIGDQSLKYTVEPAEGTLSELHTIAIAFDDCEEAVWNIEAIQTERSLCPTISSGESMKENLINLTSEGNVLYLAPYGSEAWTEAGSYIVTVPAGSYSVDGREGDEIVLAYVLSGVTAVDSLFGEKKNFDVYDINGRLIIRNADAAAVKALRGIYVIDGRKYIIR